MMLKCSIELCVFESKKIIIKHALPFNYINLKSIRGVPDLFVSFETTFPLFDIMDV